MKYVALFLAFSLVTAQAAAHEMTPTYPELRPSYMDGLYSTTMSLFNRRGDVSYYDVSVFDEDWKGIAFASRERLIEIDYLEKKDFEIYIRESDLSKVEYICTTSKLLSSDVTSTAVTSRICSRIKRD